MPDIYDIIPADMLYGSTQAPLNERRQPVEDILPPAALGLEPPADPVMGVEDIVPPAALGLSPIQQAAVAFDAAQSAPPRLVGDTSGLGEAAPVTLATGDTLATPGAARIDPGIARIIDLEEQARTGDPRAQIALDAQRMADIGTRAREQARVARENADRAKADADARREQEAAQAQSRAEAAQEALGVRRAELDDALKSGKPPLSTSEKAGLVASAILAGLATGLSRGKLRSDPTAAINGFMERRAQGHAQRLAELRERAAGSQGELSAANDALTQSRVDYELSLERMQRDLAADLTKVAENATDSVQRLDAQNAAARAVQQADAAAARALAAEEENQLKLGKTAAEIAETDAKTRKLNAEALAAENKAAGIGKGKSGKPNSFSLYGDPELVELAKVDPKTAALIRENGVRDPLTGKILRHDDGGFFAPGAKDAEAARKQMSASAEVHELSSKLIALRAKHGSEADFLKSDAWQTMQATATRLQLVLKESNETGALDKGSLEVLAALSGGDPTAIRGTSAALRTLIANTERSQQLRLGGLGFRGTYKFPALKEPKPRTREDAGAVLAAPYDPRSGTVISAADRMAAFEEQRQIDSKGTGGLITATEGAIESGQRLLKESLARRERLLADRETARDVGDGVKLQRLKDAYDQEQLFARQLDQKLVEYDRLLKEQSAKTEKNDKAAERYERETQTLEGADRKVWKGY